MADLTTLAESSQALFCAIADYIGANQTNKLFDPKKVKDYTSFRSTVGTNKIKAAAKAIETPGVQLRDLEAFLNKDTKWYISSLQIAKKLINDINKIDPDFKIAQQGFNKIFYFRGDQDVMGNIEKLFKIANRSGYNTQTKFGNINKWNPADIYLATDKAKREIINELKTAQAKERAYTFQNLNILTSDLIDSGDLFPLSLKKTTKEAELQMVNFDRKDEVKLIKKIAMRDVTNWRPYQKVPYPQKGETRDMRAFLNNGGEIKFRHDPSAKRFVAEFIGGGAEARGGSIGSIKLFCELFELVDKETSKKVLKEYQEGEKQYFIDLKLIENLRGTDKKLFDHERGAISAINIINRIMPILKNWFTKTDQKKVDDFIKIIYQYITSRTPLSGKFIIAKG